MNKKKLLILTEKAKLALKELDDEVLLEVSVGWKPITGLIGGCLEQLEDIKDEIEAL